MNTIKILQPEDLDSSSFSNDGTDAQGGVKIRLDPSDTNLLTLTKKGLYYSPVAPADISNLYVDAVNGDDNNAGTKAKPLKTVKGAFAKMKIGQTSKVYLKEKQTHNVYSSDNKTLSNKSFSFTAYGDTLSAIARAKKPEFNNWHYWNYNLKEVIDVIPTLRFIADLEYEYGGEQKLYPFFFSNNEVLYRSRGLNFDLIKIDISDVRNGSPLSVSQTNYGITSDTWRYTDQITCVGCVFKLPKNEDNAFHFAKINGANNASTIFVSCYYDTEADLANSKYLLSRVSDTGQSVLSISKVGRVNNPGERFNTPYNTITNCEKPYLTIANTYPSIQQDVDFVKPNSVLLYP